MSRAYPALAFLAGFTRVIGWLVAILGILAALAFAVTRLALRAPYGLLGVGAALASIPFSAFVGVGLVASGEWIDLHLELAANSRRQGSAPCADEPLDWAA